ncbi:MAG: SUMF1/EgtB/PvdO family nonheme iron enzyme [Sorangiineae bacterium]|nr:SUMF1/EgtB/PvdO family nonheme iron enzyme [Polyangiaceae bacterium]MEB2321988.1 SUMF1/EgtB/PvdO family nonheme iron enzyme [Sorangiineae bacterium]
MTASRSRGLAGAAVVGVAAVVVVALASWSHHRAARPVVLAPAARPQRVPPSAGGARPAAATPGAPPAATQPTTRARELDEPPAACPGGMLLVEGTWCPYVGHRCVKWLSEKADRCERYAPPPICEGRLQLRRFCIDRYEYPNLAGVLPAVMVSWEDAAAACRAEHKRLCTASEWTFACEGTERLPYPYGYTRDSSACNIDRRYRLPDLAAFDEPRKVAAELARIDQRVPSGSMARCVSPFGVHDMTGNVDEWVVNESRDPVVSGLKGGYFGPVRARCRPMTVDHNQWFRFYQVGFRCCAAAAPAEKGDAVPSRTTR